MKALGRLPLLVTLFALGLGSCSTPNEPQLGSQTNWLRVCESDRDCGELSCLCGACTETCDDDAECGAAGASCFPKKDAKTAAFCDGAKPKSGMCLVACEEGSCPEGSSCLGGVCTSVGLAPSSVLIDTTLRYQTLTGFGASLAYDENAILNHPSGEALFDALFLDSGFDIIRFRNRFDGTNAGDLGAASEIIGKAKDRLGHLPILVMTSGSPPAVLKANSEEYCANSDPSCTLARNGANEFDYAGLAAHFRASLDAYAAIDVAPDYLSIQNNPDWIPQGAVAVEACRFLPVEGSVDVTLPSGDVVNAPFAGYSEALAAVSGAIGGLANPPKLAAPEVGSAVMAGGYTDQLDPALYAAVAVHFYGTDPNAIDVQALESLASISVAVDKPVFQLEMQSRGIETAILAHHAVTTARASAYVQHQIATASDPENTPTSLVALYETTFARMTSYYALVHFARHTDPGWVRVGASREASGLLTSAWLSPSEKALTIVIINPNAAKLDVLPTIPDTFVPFLESSEIERTTFDGVERMAKLGPLPTTGRIRVPGHSMITLAISGE